MSESIQRTRPSFLEAGLPCASLSAECQRDNNARQRPPQNRLHIWWARRPPTICRAAILASLLPHDMALDPAVLPPLTAEPKQEDLETLPAKMRPHRAFFERLLTEVSPTHLAREHSDFLRAMGVTGDGNAVFRRLALRDEESGTGPRILLPDSLVFRYPSPFGVSPSSELLHELASLSREMFALGDEPIVVLDAVAGGGSIPLEAVRYGLKVYANDLNPVASLVLKATTEYPSRYGRLLTPHIQNYGAIVNDRVRERLLQFFPAEHAEVWWESMDANVINKLRSRQVLSVAPEGEAVTRDYLWARTIPCSRCDLNIPLSTNFTIVSEKGKPEASIGAFPEVPAQGAGNDCTFHIVPCAQWGECRWPRPGFIEWDPRLTPTFRDGKAECPRCGNVVDGEAVKSFAKARVGGLPAQMYAVCSQVPVKITYRNGDVKTRYLWRFRPPTAADLEAERNARQELARLSPGWEALDLIPTEEVPVDMEDKRPREYGMSRWRDLFLPRQLLTVMVVLEEIRKVQTQVRAELPAETAEAVNVYLAFILSKVVNYNSVNTFWDYTRKKSAQTFSRHDFAFRPAFCEFEGARETVMWGASQVAGAYEQLARLIHGEPVSLEGGDDEEVTEEADASDLFAEEAGDDIDAVATVEVVGTQEPVHLRPEVIPPTITNNDAAALDVPAPGSVHLVCIDPPYYNNVQYSELSNFFYVWLKRALRDEPGLQHLFRETLAESNREAVANEARWRRETERETAAWQLRYDEANQALRAANIRVAEAKRRALETVGPKPLNSRDRADRFYEDKMAQIFRRMRQLLHPAGRMVVMFNHKQTEAWRSLGMALTRAGFEIRSSFPVHTEAESSLNIRGLDAARSTVLLLCVPREDREQPVGNWARVQARITQVARSAAARFSGQGITGTDLYLSSLGPTLGEVGRNWPLTDFGGGPIDMEAALDESYKAVGAWRLEQILTELSAAAGLAGIADTFRADAVDGNTRILWLWLDAFQGSIAGSDDVRKLAKSLNVNPDEFKRMSLIEAEKDMFKLRAPQEVDLRLLARRLRGGEELSRQQTRAADAWEERTFPNFLGAAVWNAIALMTGTEGGPRGPEALTRWLRESEYGGQSEFRGAFAVTLYLLEKDFARRPETDVWGIATHQARRAWDLVLQNWRG